MPVNTGGGRYSIIQSCAVDDIKLSFSGLRMLVVLGTYSNPQGYSWPKQETLAKRLGVSRQAITKAIGELEALGYITITYETTQHGGFVKRAKYRLVQDLILPEERYRSAASDDESVEAPPVQATPELHGQATPELPADPTGNSPVAGTGNSPVARTGNPRVAYNVPSEHPQENTPNKSTRTSTPVDVPRSFPNDTKGPTWGPSKDGQPPLEWERLLIEHCYGGVGLPEWGQQRRSVGFLRTNYPLKVVLDYFDERMRTMKGERRTLTPKLLATDIVSWAGLTTALQRWEANNGRDAIDRCGTGDAGAADREPTPLDERARRAVDFLNAPRFVRPVQGRHVAAASGD